GLLKANDPAQHDAEDAAQLEQAIMALPEEQREVLVLKVFEQLTFREIAAVMSISENTAASRYRYALAKLRESCNAQPGS
ncbi:MAG: sigma-70 family RNA polymerase sigma factor, partial [Planctomycetes bacterium]|nr:sigma-70 family RNA polymerase sigma factor [Planctomycetota bacterium]